MPRIAKDKYYVILIIVVGKKTAIELYLKDAMTRELTTDNTKALTTDESNAIEFITFMNKLEPKEDSFVRQWRIGLK